MGSVPLQTVPPPNVIPPGQRLPPHQPPTPRPLRVATLLLLRLLPPVFPNRHLRRRVRSPCQPLDLTVVWLRRCNNRRSLELYCLLRVQDSTATWRTPPESCMSACCSSSSMYCFS